MIRRFALHLGAHKTATTFIQRRLDQEQGRLRAQGVAFFGPPELRQHDVIRFPTPKMVQDGAAAEVQAATAAAYARIVGDAVDDSIHRVLISEENILGSSRLNLRRACLYPALPARLACLPDAWGQRDAEIFLGLRDYASFFASCQSTVALLGDWMDLGLARQERIAALPRRWPDILAEIRARYPEAVIHVWRHEDVERIGATLVEAMAGHPVEIDFSQKGTMAALSEEGMRRIRKAWHENDREPLPQEMVRQIRHETTDGFPPHQPWLRHLELALSETYAEDWQRIVAMPRVKALGA